MRASGLACAPVVMAFALGARADDARPPDAQAEMHAELERQAADIERLKADLAEERGARQNPPVRLSGYAQVDWTVYNQASQNEVDFSTNQPLNQDRFTLRRGHLRVDAAHGPVFASLEIDANTVNGPQVRPIDAELSVRWPDAPDARLPELVATLGLMKVPFGFEVPELDNVRPFLERATVMRALFPGEFDLGARLAVRYRFVDWTIAVMNGNPIGDKVFPALAPDRTKEVVGRLGARVEIAAGARFEAGVSADAGIGFHEGTPTTKDQLIWRDENGDGIVQPTEIQVIPGSAATPSQEFRRFAVGAEARLFIPISPIGNLALRAEVVRGENLDRAIEYADPVGAGHDLRELGWSVGATQEITPWAMIGVRYDQYNPDQDASQELAIRRVPADRTYGTLALMAMLRYGRHVPAPASLATPLGQAVAARSKLDDARLLVEYDRNGNALGRAANGTPTTLRDDALTVRGQVTF